MTHDVTNQPPPLSGSNAWRGDPLLVQLSEDFSPEVRKELDSVGRFVMSAEAQDLARLANTELPKLRTHDRQGRRADLVEFHPAYHALMRRSVMTGLHSSVWENGEHEAGRRHQVRAARFYMTAELECGHLCPITMTNASLAALMAAPKLFREDLAIDWSRPAKAVHDHVRALTPYPGAWTTWEGETLKIFGTRLPDEAPEVAGPAGTVAVVDGRLFVACGERVVEVTRVQRQGKRRMETADFLNGAEVDGAVLG